MRGILCFIGSILLAVPLGAQVAINGPMPGHVDMLAAAIWMQCKGPCTARLEYWRTDREQDVMRTESQRSNAARAHAMTFRLDRLEPGISYGYRVLVDERPVHTPEPLILRTQPLWKWRGDPPDLTLATGSCTYFNEPAYDRPGRPFGGDPRIFNTIADERPDLMIWLGDNIYLREPDWGTREGYLYRYTHARSAPELQRLLRSTVHYATWDDHDFGPNDADGSWWNAAVAKETFDLFWANPTSGAPGVDPGITTAFTHGDVDFFLLDGRTFRVPPSVVTTTPTLLGAPQIDWLIRALKYSNAPFKVVALGGQFLNTAAVFENYATYADERAALIDRIDREGLTGVVFITGDRHFTELSRLDLSDGRWILDLTCSPLTAGTFPPKEENLLRVPGTLVTEWNFALLRFSGPRGARTMTIQVKDTAGKLLWERRIDQPKRP